MRRSAIPLAALALALGLAGPAHAQSEITNTATAETASPGLRNLAFIDSPTPEGFDRDNNVARLISQVVDTATVTSDIVTEADLAVTKTATPTTVPAGGTVVFRIEVENLGPSSAQDVTVEDALPAELAFVSVDAGSATCTTPAVGANGTVSCTFAGATAPNVVRVVEITAEAPVTGSELSLDNVATASSPTSDPVTTNDTDRTTVAVAAAAVITIPTLSGVGLAVLWIALAGLGLLAIRRSARA